MKKLAINPSNKKYYSDDYIKGWENGVNAQYEATKDAVEVVRCKDCRHSRIEGDATLFMWCGYWNKPTDGNRYCSDGERREP